MMSFVTNAHVLVKFTNIPKKDRQKRIIEPLHNKPDNEEKEKKSIVFGIDGQIVV